MQKIVPIIFLTLLLLIPFNLASAASDQAMQLRNRNGLSEFKPSEAFLAGNFVADEDAPDFIFGKIGDFAKSRSCPTTWLIEEGERQRIQKAGAQSSPVEYTLYLEEDCPGKVVYYIFVDRSQANAAQWMEWRKQFHKNKAEQQYGAAKAAIEKAARDGFNIDGELRFVEVGGDLILQKMEDHLMGDLKFKPLYNLKEGKAVSR